MQYIFFLRFQLLFFILLATLPTIALCGAPSLLANLLVAESVWDVVAVTLAAFAICWVIGWSMAAVVKYAPERFDPVPPLVIPSWVRLFNSVLSGFAALPIFVAVVSDSGSPFALVGGLFVVGLVLRFVRADIARARNPSQPKADHLSEQAPRFATRVPLQLISLFRRSIDAVLRKLGPGYSDRETKEVYVEHRMLAALAFVVLIPGYVLGRYAFAVGSGLRSNYIAAPLYLELSLFAIALLLSNVAFFLDRFRVPVTPILLGWSLVGWGLYDVDHYYTIFPPPSRAESGSSVDARPLDVSSAMEKWLVAQQMRGQKPTLIVVCASGGGIQAAAWTARVLTGLTQELGEAFPRSLRLISSVSGGSVGAMYFVETLYQSGRREKGGLPAPADLDFVVTAATTSSLDSTAWGIAYPDLARIFAPMLVSSDEDRGWAIEQAWRAAAIPPPPPRYPHSFPELAKAFAQNFGYAMNVPLPLATRLSEWRSAVAAGWLPATIFNATVTELGSPFLLSTVDLPKNRDRLIFGAGPGTYNGADISVVTAARLSASFPYVSPASTACYKAAESRPGCLDNFDKPPGRPHIADGGYFDNFGIESAVAWLDSVLPSYQGSIGGVVIVQLHAFPDPSPVDNSRARVPRQTGWLTETLGPAATLLATRPKLQNLIDQRALEELKARYPAGFINTIVFQTFHDGPLSWHLSEQEKHNIECDWRDERTLKEVAYLGDLMHVAVNTPAIAPSCK